MMPYNLSQTVIVLDLDDTLYPEIDYVHSGMRYVGAQLEMLRNVDLKPVIHKIIANDEKDWLGFLCQSAGLPVCAKESLLWLYRLHVPTIHLLPQDEAALEELEKRAKAVTVLTDGRSVTQRLKLKALGLSRFPIYVSEEFKSEKPDLLRFKMIQDHFPAAGYVYVGDNPRKDFVAPHALGWMSVGIRRVNGIHAQRLTNLPPEAMPNYWINELSELIGLF
jgi:putative hydrolase of the HAD superfamily